MFTQIHNYFFFSALIVWGFKGHASAWKGLWWPSWIRFPSGCACAVWISIEWIPAVHVLQNDSRRCDKYNYLSLFDKSSLLEHELYWLMCDLFSLSADEGSIGAFCPARRIFCCRINWYIIAVTHWCEDFDFYHPKFKYLTRLYVALYFCHVLRPGLLTELIYLIQEGLPFVLWSISNPSQSFQNSIFTDWFVCVLFKLLIFLSLFFVNALFVFDPSLSSAKK